MSNQAVCGTDWHGGNEIILEHWQELVWQAYWFLSVVPATTLKIVDDNDLYWRVATSGYSGLAVQTVESFERRRKV